MIRSAFLTAPRARRSLAAVSIAIAAALAPAPASADAVTEGALRALVAAVDGSADWNATIQSIASDSSGAGVLSGLHVESATAGMTIDIDKLTVTRGSAGGDGRYGATKVAAGNVTIAAGPLSVTLANIVLDDFSAPGGISFAFDPARPFSSITRAYAALAKTHVGQAKVTALALTEKLANTSSRVTYNDVTLTRLDGGKIASLTAGPLITESPVADKANPKPLVTVRVARAEARDLDLAALLKVYDVAPPGTTRNWQPAVANATYRDAVIDVAPRDSKPSSITIKLGTISLDDFKVRPGERSVADDLDRAILMPFEDGSGDPAGMLNILSAYSVGKLSMTPIDISTTGTDLQTFHFDGLSIANLSLDGVGEFALTGLSAGVRDIGTLKAGRIAFGGLTFPKSDVFASGLRTALSGGDVDFSTLAPVVGFLDLGAIDLAISNYPSTHLGKLRLDFSNHLGNVPTSVKFGITDADLDAVLMPGIARDLLSRYGYTRVKTEVAGTIAWNEQQKRTTLTGVKLNVKDAGTLTIDATLNGPARADFEKLDSLGALMAFGDKLALVSATVSFKDDSIVGRVLNEQASGVKVDPERYRDQIVRGLPFMLLPVGTSDFQKKAMPVFQEFLRTPGTITFTANPAMPVGLPALIAGAQSAGLFNLPTVLNLNVSGTPGPKPPTPAPAPVSPATVPPTPPASGNNDIRGTVPAPK
jgi:hypothetical protein